MDEIEEVVEGIFRFAGITVRTLPQSNGLFKDFQFRHQNVKLLTATLFSLARRCWTGSFLIRILA